MPVKIRAIIGLLLALLATPIRSADAAAITAGPMLGPVAMREAKLWIRTNGPADARIAYAPAEAKADALRHTTATLRTRPAEAHTATFTLRDVEPGRTYRYTVHLDGEATDATGEFTTPAFYHGRQPPPDIRIAAGGAHYVAEEGFEPPYQNLGGGNGVFETIREKNPDLMLWVGDTAHLRQSDWTSRAGYLKRFARARGKAELQALLKAVPHYGIWGARDYAYHDAGRLYSHRSDAEAAFRAFWPRPVDIPAPGESPPVSGFPTWISSSSIPAPTATNIPSPANVPASSATVKLSGSGAPSAAAPRPLKSSWPEHPSSTPPTRRKI